MGKHLEYFDEFGRSALTNELVSILKDKSLSDELMSFVTKVLRKCVANEDEFIREVIENVINEIRDPIDEQESEEMKSKKKKILDMLQSSYTERDIARRQKKDAIENEQFVDAERAKNAVIRYSTEIEALEKELLKLQKSDLDTWKRVLVIVGDLLEYTKQPIYHPFLRPLADTTLNLAIGHKDPEIREPGLLVFGLYCLLEKETAKRYLPLFAEVLQHDQLALKYLTLKIVFDLFTVFDFSEEKHKIGTNEESPCRNGSGDDRGKYAPSVLRLLEILFSFLTYPDEDLLACAIEGFSKLLLLNRLPINHEEVLCQLILNYFSIRTEKNEHIRQSLAIFFPYFITNDKNKELLMSCLMPCLRTVAYASAQSPYRKENASTLADFILSIIDVESKKSFDTCQAKSVCTMDKTQYGKLVFDILFEIEAGSDDEAVFPFCKVLQVLNIDNKQQENIKCWKVLVDEIMGRIKKKKCLVYLRRFKELLQTADSTPNEVISDILLKKLEDRKNAGVEKARIALEEYSQSMPDEECEPVKTCKRKRRKSKSRCKAELVDIPRKRKRIMSVQSVRDVTEEKPIASVNMSSLSAPFDQRNGDQRNESQLLSTIHEADTDSSSSSPPSDVSSSSEIKKYLPSKEERSVIEQSRKIESLKRSPPIKEKKYKKVKPKRAMTIEEEESEEDEIDKFIALTANKGVTDPDLEALLSDSDES